jgi:hypothetical protein
VPCRSLQEAKLTILCCQIPTTSLWAHRHGASEEVDNNEEEPGLIQAGLYMISWWVKSRHPLDPSFE